MQHPDLVPGLPVDNIGLDPLSGGPEPWTWWSLALYLTAIFIHLVFTVRKWRRDQVRAGFMVSPVFGWGYFSRYRATEPLTFICAISFFWAWAGEHLDFTLFGAEFNVPYVPHMAFIVGWFADSIARHLLKVLRNIAVGPGAAPVEEPTT